MTGRAGHAVFGTGRIVFDITAPGHRTRPNRNFVRSHRPDIYLVNVCTRSATTSSCRRPEFLSDNRITPLVPDGLNLNIARRVSILNP